MNVRDITNIIEQFAPLSLQESYDNSGLIVGRGSDEVHKALLAVDVTDEVLDEAEREGCDMIITHHPIIFKPLKRFNSSNYVERCVERAIRRGIVLYACHTNLDSTVDGMSWRLASMLGIENLRTLHPLGCENNGVGFGVVGELSKKNNTMFFLKYIQSVTNSSVIRHSAIVKDEILKIAVCTGSGGSLMEDARRAGVDMYVTADLKYNDFMTPDSDFIVADIGHFESEYCAIDILCDILSKKICTFAVRRSGSGHNPIHYLV